MLRLRPAIAGALLIATSPQFALAQAIDLGPSFGYYRPLGRFDAAQVYSSDLPTQPSELSGLAWGAEARVAFRNRASIETAFSTIASTLPPFGNPGFGGVEITRERVNVLTLEAQYDVAPSQGSSQLLLSAGPTMIQHRGGGYSRYGSPRSFGGVVGLEFVHAVTQQLQLVAHLRGLAYSFNLANPPEHGHQLDGLVAVGVRWHAHLGAVSPNER